MSSYSFCEKCKAVVPIGSACKVCAGKQPFKDVGDFFDLFNTLTRTAKEKK